MTTETKRKKVQRKILHFKFAPTCGGSHQGNLSDLVAWDGEREREICVENNRFTPFNAASGRRVAGFTYHLNYVVAECGSSMSV